MKLKKITVFSLLLTALCGCTTQPSNDTNNMLETKTYLYSYDYETEPNGELSTAYHEEKPSVDLNEPRDVVRATVNFKKNAVTYIKMNEQYSFGSCECAITQAYVTSDSNYFYTLVNENYHNILSDEISKQRDISKETGKLIDDTSRFFCVKVHMKYTGKEAMTMDIYSTIFSKDTNNEILFLGFLMFIDKSFSIHKLDNIYLEPNEEYDMWFFYNLSNYSSDNTYYVKGNFQNYNDNNSYNGYLIELNDLTEID